MKKNYKWEQIIKMSLVTKFRIKGWAESKYFMFDSRTENGIVNPFMIIQEGNKITELAINSIYLFLELGFVEDLSFEIYHDYVSGIEALTKLVNGEWLAISCDDKDWRHEYVYISSYDNFRDEKGTYMMKDEFSPTYLKLKKWYEHKGEIK